MTCPSCGAALAEDQRYCLNCGQRQGEPRVDFRRHLNAPVAATKEPVNAGGNGRGEPAAVPPPIAAAPSPHKHQRDYAPLAAAGGIAVLGVMLLIGVLIGRGTGSTTSSSPPPQVVTVAAGATEGGGDAGKSPQDGSGSKGAKKQSKKKADSAKDLTGGGGGTGGAAVASDATLRELQEQSPEEYQESSAKLPDEIATPGKAPPADNKAPGGGSGGVTIE